MSNVKLSHHPEIHGAMVEFDTPEDLIAACERAYEAGFRNMDAYAPMPVEGLAEAIGFRKNRVATIALCRWHFRGYCRFLLPAMDDECRLRAQRWGPTDK